MSVQKTVGAFALAACGLAGISALATASPAFALGWNANAMIQNTTGSTGGMTAANITQESFADWVTTFTTWILGLAIVAFVLKVVLTAVDRLVFGSPEAGKGGGGGRGGRGGDEGGVLCKIPLIGAYQPNVPWKDVFIFFGKNLAIVAGAWVIVQILTGVILFVFTALAGGGQ